MRVLFDLVHPADALFFHHAIETLRRNGRDVVIVSRDKDVLIPLLNDLGWPHRSLTAAGEGRLGLARELVQRDYRLWRLARQVRPDVMVGFGGVAISHVGKLLGIPSLSFYDTEHAGLQMGLTLPFISEWHVPQGWQGPEAKGRTFHFRGGKQFAYLHPDHFVPSREIAVKAGLDPRRDNFMVRTVAWKANHDHGRSGFSLDRLRQIVSLLSKRGQVHISAEGELPPDLEPMRYRGGALAFHHLLGCCRLFCGESITVASEAVALGVPALLQIDNEYGYVAEQEKARLVYRLAAPDDPAAAIARALAESPEAYRARAKAFAASMDDLNRYVVDAIERTLASRAGSRASRRA